ncbi:hypothetical protein Mgra_00010080 [Meloidogyne graminicola]|uniref:DUF7515 domain-containing protein n=1 Tax=Meloidogyne graminicola TaxID=189291 RepID=A0A8S9ZD33_9BILA|nr:hypothetical protein Mgra_00010080 [Meloidogyne graminicola]
MADECLLNLENFSLSDEGQSSQQGSDNEGIAKIQDFCNKIASTLRANEIGYIRDWDLGLHVFEDNGIDPFKLSLQLGFNSFEEFLRSEHMKPFIEIDDSDGVTTYHYPISKSGEKTAIHKEQAASFLELEKARKIRMRNNLNTRNECPNAERILAKRYKKRLGIEDELDKEEEERKKRNSSRYAVGRGKQVYVSRSSRPWPEKTETTGYKSLLLGGLISGSSSNSNRGTSSNSRGEKTTSVRGRRLSNRAILFSL